MTYSKPRPKQARRWFKAVTAIGVTILLLAAQRPARADMPAVLNEAPENAHFILIIPDLSRLNDKIALLNTELDLQVPEMTNALDAFKRESGMVEGLDDTGALLFVIPDLASAIANQQPPKFAMLIPVSDYDAFVGNFGGEGGDGVSQLTLPDGQTSYCKHMGDYAVMGEDQDTVSWYEAAKPAKAIEGKVGQAGVEAMGDCDVALYIDLEAIAPALSQQIDDMASGAVEEFDAMGAAGMVPDAAIDMNMMMIRVYAEAFKGILDGSRAVVAAANITNVGIELSYTLEMKKGSTMASMFPAGSKGAASTLARLPDQPYIVAFAMDYAGIDMAALMDKMIAAVPDGDQNAFMSMYKEATPLIELTNSAAGVFYPPDPAAMMTGGLLNMLAVYEVKDGEKFVQANKAYFESLNALQDAADGGGMAFNTSYTENAMQIEGVRVDQYSYTIAMPPEMMQAMGPAAMFGATGYSGYIARKDNRVLLTTSLDAQLITQGIKTVEADTGIGSAGAIDELRQSVMPENCFVEVYVSPGGVAHVVNMFAPMFGAPPLAIPADTAPLAMGVGREGNALTSRTYVSLSTVKTVKTAIEDMYNAMQQQMQQQPMGGGPGGAPPPPYN